MAKNWKPTLKQLSVYDELLKRQNYTRKRLLRRRRIMEEESSFGRGLPTLVIPMKAKRFRDITRYRFDSYKEYREKLKALRELYGTKGSPLKQYYMRTYKENILNMIQDWIKNKIGFTEEPADPYRAGQTKPYYYSDIQIAEVGKKDGRILMLYNELKSLESAKFMALYDADVMPTPRMIYNDITSMTTYSEIDYFIEDFDRLKSKIVNTEYYRRLVDDARLENRPDWINNYGESVKSRSKKRFEEIKSERYKEPKML